MPAAEPSPRAWPEPSSLKTGEAKLAVHDALDKPLRQVVKALRRAAEDPSVKRIHGLRTRVRRAEAALELFDERLPRGKVSWWTKRLKRARKVAGKVRDVDLFAATLLAGGVQPDDSLYRRVLELRRQTSDRAAKKLNELARRRWKAKRRKLLKGLRWPDHAPRGASPMNDGLARRIDLAIADFWAALPKSDDDPLSLHAFRIQAKKLRYALEILAPCAAGSAFSPAIPVLRKLQGKLGQVQDAVTQLSQLRTWSDDADRDDEATHYRALQRVSDAQQTRLIAALHEYRDWFSKERQAALREVLPSVPLRPS